MTIIDCQFHARRDHAEAAPARRAELARSRPVNYEQAVEPLLKTDRLSDTPSRQCSWAAPAPGRMAGRRRKSKLSVGRMSAEPQASLFLQLA